MKAPIVLKSKKESLLARLHVLYPNPQTELSFSSEYELVVSVVLSAQCTDKKVNEVTPSLFSAFPSFKTLSQAQVSQIEGIIRPVNYYRTKAKNLVALASMVETQYHGELPRSHEDLVSLPGVGRKTANVVLGELGIAPALPVDTHVFRLSHRLGLSRGASPEEVERDLCRTFPPQTWRTLHHSLILHGRRVCKAQRPACDQCSLLGLCPFGRSLKKSG